MRTRASFTHSGAVRFIVEMQSDAAGSVHGTVTPDGRDPSAFSGWLDLIRQLEERTDDIHSTRREQP